MVETNPEVAEDPSRVAHRVSTGGEARNEPQRIRATEEEVRKDRRTLDVLFESVYLSIEADLASCTPVGLR